MCRFKLYIPRKSPDPNQGACKQKAEQCFPLDLLAVAVSENQYRDLKNIYSSNIIILTH